MDLQRTLENESFRLKALKTSDFELLFAVASDPLIWEQHPNKNRYQRTVFTTFFQGALESKGAYLIIDKASSSVIGSTRFYDFDPDSSEVFIGYTFFARSYWGSKANRQVKEMMLNHAFHYVKQVKFHIGSGNIRSQKAIEKLGAEKLREMEVSYYGEESKLNFEYGITARFWQGKRVEVF